MVVVVEELITELSGNCMKYLDTLNKVQIDQKSAAGLPIVPAYCLTITLKPFTLLVMVVVVVKNTTGSCRKYLSPVEGDPIQHQGRSKTGLGIAPTQQVTS